MFNSLRLDAARYRATPGQSAKTLTDVTVRTRFLPDFKRARRNREEK